MICACFPPFFFMKNSGMFSILLLEVISILHNSLLISSSYLIASLMCFGVIVFFLFCSQIIPAYSMISPVNHSRTPARKTPVDRLNLSLYLPCLTNLLRRATGNTIPALASPLNFFGFIPDFFADPFFAGI